MSKEILPFDDRLQDMILKLMLENEIFAHKCITYIKSKYFFSWCEKFLSAKNNLNNPTNLINPSSDKGGGYISP